MRRVCAILLLGGAFAGGRAEEACDSEDPVPKSAAALLSVRSKLVGTSGIAGPSWRDTFELELGEALEPEAGNEQETLDVCHTVFVESDGRRGGGRGATATNGKITTKKPPGLAGGKFSVCSRDHAPMRPGRYLCRGTVLHDSSALLEMNSTGGIGAGWGNASGMAVPPAIITASGLVSSSGRHVNGLFGTQCQEKTAALAQGAESGEWLVVGTIVASVVILGVDLAR
uniref:Uncharacterized protein n=1 Tax=Alexandrium catenella TaxID=2925 RepID=A0A7S1Q4E6_ALECA|mmetsp:Transcript_15227/g.41616  ORF Transcript_15227/g.41616 Transcript_15227/m.41616 type:complete len:228 (+) Transcript_15227:91-774(+)